jgi:hypothetical protein
MKLKKIATAALALLLATLACNLPSTSPTDTPSPTGTPTSTETSTPSPSPTATDTPLIPISGVSSPPQVSVSVATNCRTGPSTKYDLIIALQPGQAAQVVGKYTPSNYWIIKTPAGGICWLWGQYASITGDTSSLPEFPVPPLPTSRFTSTPQFTTTSTGTPAPTDTPTPTSTATEAPPQGPANLTQSRTCNGGFRGVTPIWIEDVSLSWQDIATNETGYRVSKNNSPLPDIPADSTTFQISLRYDQGTGGALFDNFGVVAFNNTGSSTMASIDVPRCP